MIKFLVYFVFALLAVFLIVLMVCLMVRAIVSLLRWLFPSKFQTVKKDGLL